MPPLPEKRTPNLPVAGYLDEVIGHTMQAGVRKTVRVSMSTVQLQMAQGIEGGVVTFLTRTEALANLAYADKITARVVQDPTPAYNGYYRKSGPSGAGTWTRTGDLPYSFIRLNVTGGTANAIIAESEQPVPSMPLRSLYFIVPAATNTGPVTITLGATTFSVTDQDGDQLGPGYFLAGRIITLFYNGAAFQVLSDVQAEFWAGEAQAAAAAASANLNAALPSAVPDDLTARTIAPTTPYINVLNWYSDTVLAPAAWVPTVGNVEPTHAMKRLTANGVWLELSATRGVGEFDPRHFGRVPDKGNATDAFVKMVELMLWKQGGTALVPPGSYHIEAPLGRSFNAGLANEYAFRGLSTHTCRLIFDGPSFTGSGHHLLGFKQTALGVNGRGTAKDFSILCDGVIDSEPCDFSRPTGGIAAESTIEFRRVSIRGLNYINDHFKRGFNAKGQLFPIIHECEFAGNSYLGGPALPYDNAHPWYQADLAFNLDNTYGGDIQANVGRFVKESFSNRWPEGHTGAAGEGVVMIGNRAGNCLKGYTYFRPSPEPANRWENNYADARDCGFDIQGSFAGTFDRNESYVYAGAAVPVLTHSPVDSGTPVDFHFKGCYEMEIKNSRHRGADVRKAAYVFQSMTTPLGATINPREIRVREPVFEGWSGHSLFRAYVSSTNSRIIKPKICANSNITNMAFGNHSIAEWAIDHEDDAKVVLGLSAPQSIPSGVLTDVLWTSEDQDDYNCHAANSAEIIVPVNKAVRSFRAILQGSYNTSGFTGYRQFELHRNGVLVPQLSDVQAASQPYRIGRPTELISCTGGQVLKIVTQQNSGTAQDLSNGQTRLTIIWSGEKGI